MRLINAEKLRAEAIESCKFCHLNGSKYCREKCEINALTKLIDNAPTVVTNKIEYKAYNEGFKDGVEQGIKLSENPAIPTFNREQLEKARDYWYQHLEVGNEEQNEAAWCAINAIKYCIEHSSGYQKDGAEE